MADTLQNIMHQLVLIEQAATPPPGQKAITQATDEPPDTVNIFPAAVNLERSFRAGDQNANDSTSFGAVPVQYLRHRIDVHLLFAPVDVKYSVRERRPWVNVLVNAINNSNNLNGSVSAFQIIDGNFNPVAFNGFSYNALTICLDCTAATA